MGAAKERTASVEMESKQSLFLAGVICFIGFLLGVETGGLQFILLKMAREFDLSQTTMGSLVSMQFIAVTAAPLLTGALSDKVGKKSVVIAACFVFAASSVMTIYTQSIAGLGIGICGVGVAFGSLEATITGALSDAYPGRSGKYLAVMQGFLSLGAVLGPLAVNFATFHWHMDWRILFWICCSFSLLAGGLSCRGRFVRIRREKKEGTSFPFIDKVLIIAMVMIFLYLFVENGVTCFMDTFFVTVLEQPAYSAVALSVFWAAMAVSRMVTSMFYKQKNILILCMCFVAFVLLLLLNFTETWQNAMAIFAMIGLCYGPLWPFLMNIAVERNPERSGTVAGFMLAASGLGGAASPMLAGFIADHAHLRVAYLFIGIMVFLEFLLYLYFIKAEKQ